MVKDGEIILTKQQLDAIMLLVYGDKSKKQVASEIGVTEQTLYNWHKDEGFRNALQLELIHRVQLFREDFVKPWFDTLVAGLKSLKELFESNGNWEVKKEFLYYVLENAEKLHESFSFISARYTDAVSRDQKEIETMNLVAKRLKELEQSMPPQVSK